MKNWINISDLTPQGVGLPVTHHAHNGKEMEHGKISSWNDTYIFVIYDGKSHSQATSPLDLTRQYTQK